MFGTLLGGRRRDLEALREQEAEAARQTRDVITGRGGPVAFVAIDLLWLDGQSLLDVPLLERKRQLDSVLQESQLVRRGTYVRPSARGSLVAWKALGFGALAYKAANSRYLPGQRNDAWVTVPISTVVRPTG
jgi:ATP-dependent DNA ligase